METLQITLLGAVRVVHPNISGPVKLTHSMQALLAYLLLQQHPVPRDVLMDVFWVDTSPDRARSSLTTALWRLRHVLEPDGVLPGTYLITNNTGEVGFNWSSGHWLDTKAFEQHIYPLLRKPRADLSDEDLKEIEHVLTLYRGELLEGMYEDWVLRERERFRSLHLNCLTRQMECHASRKNFEQSIAVGQEILRWDPLREEIHCALMRFYLYTGQRSLALRQYLTCCNLLQQELGIPPLEETQFLYEQILASSHAVARDAIVQASSQDVAQLVHELQLVKQSLTDAARALERIHKAVGRLARYDESSDS